MPPQCACAVEHCNPNLLNLLTFHFQIWPVLVPKNTTAMVIQWKLRHTHTCRPEFSTTLISQNSHLTVFTLPVPWQEAHLKCLAESTLVQRGPISGEFIVRKWALCILPSAPKPKGQIEVFCRTWTISYCVLVTWTCFRHCPLLIPPHCLK